MPSKVEALVRNFLRTDGELLCLVLGERLSLKRGEVRTVVGREALSEESFRAVADELAPGESLDRLAEIRYRVPFRLDDLSELVEIEFGLVGGVPSMTVIRTGAPRAPSPAPEISPGFPGPGPAAAGPPSPAPSPSPPPELLPPAARPEARSAPGPFRDVGGEAAAARIGSAQTIERLLVRMLGANASDLHLSSGSVPCFRVHGEICPQYDSPEMSSADIERMLQPIVPDKQREEFHERLDTDFAYEIEGVSRFRVNMFRDRKGVGAVFRQIPIQIRSASELNLPPVVIQFGDLSKGLVLVTGPTGSGKSTTLAAVIDHINETRTDHIITIEDPIEFVHPNKKCLVNQREVGSHTRGFKNALRAALREDPDIVLVGELRDLETVAIAIETAETGHLVFGTLHTTTAASTVDRIIDQFPEDRQAQIRIMLSESLRGVVSQTLLRKKGGGRVAALEILLSNNAVANLIRDGKTFQLQSVMQTSKAQGMVLLNEALVDLVKRGIVEPREAYLKAVDKLGLMGMFKSMNIAVAEPKPEGVTAGAAPGPVPVAATPAAGR